MDIGLMVVSSVTEKFIKKVELSNKKRSIKFALINKAKRINKKISNKLKLLVKLNIGKRFYNYFSITLKVMALKKQISQLFNDLNNWLFSCSAFIKD